MFESCRAHHKIATQTHPAIVTLRGNCGCLAVGRRHLHVPSMSVARAAVPGAPESRLGEARLGNLYANRVEAVVGLAPADRAQSERLLCFDLDRCTARHWQRSPQTHPASGDVAHAGRHDGSRPHPQDLERHRLVRLKPVLSSLLHVMFIGEKKETFRAAVGARTGLRRGLGRRAAGRVRCALFRRQV